MKPGPAAKDFMAFVDRNGPLWAGTDAVAPSRCWTWLGGKAKGGYGKYHTPTDKHGHRRQVIAHLYLWEQVVDLVPAGFELDHLCGTPGCVHVDADPHVSHIRVTTPRENTLRGNNPAAQNARKTHCEHGHPLSGDNLYMQPSTGFRYCRTCKNDSRRKHAVAAAARRWARREQLVDVFGDERRATINAAKAYAG